MQAAFATSKLDELKLMKSGLLKSKLRGEVTQDDYEQVSIGFTRDIGEIKKAVVPNSRPR